MHLSLLFLFTFLFSFAQAESQQPILRPIGSDFGTLGLLQIPNARFQEAGTLQVFYNRTEPYTRFGFTLQPFDWMEVAFRYTDVSNIPYGVTGSDQSFKDKAFDIKLRLIEESRWRPEVAVGFRDVVGTGQFSGEFLVASKRYENFDFTLGMGFGYVGNADDFRNPLSAIDDGFDTRAEPSEQGGTFEPSSWFSGNTALFAGVQWQSPWRRLQFLAEYEGNDYQNEPRDNNQKQSSRLNVGAIYAVSNSLDLRLAFERGDAIMFGLALHSNLASDPAPRKVADPPAVTVDLAKRATQDTSTADWQQAAQEITQSAGFYVEQIALVDNKELVVKGEPEQFRSVPKTAGRIGKVLENYAGEEIKAFTIQEQQNGIVSQDIWIPREEFRLALLEDGKSVSALEDKMAQFPALPVTGQVLYQQPQKRFDYNFGLGLRQVFGGPDNFILYQLNAQANASYAFRPNLWLDGRLLLNLLNNYDEFTYDAPSGLPRVRTDQRRYLTTSDLTLPVFQLNYTTKLSKNTYALAYAGLLESMFAGVGGEILYRAPGSRFALGLDVNAVQQRGFPQDFTLRDYQVLTGHLSAYFQVYDDIRLTVRGGRYLAGDEGVTWDIAREFANGVRFGAYATFTNVSAEVFGEGSFDKGIYITLPLDRLFVRSTLRKANIVWAPLTRDGGAILKRNQTLIDLTERLDGKHFAQDFNDFLE